VARRQVIVRKRVWYLDTENGDRFQQCQGEDGKRSQPNPKLSNPWKFLHGEHVAGVWPIWLTVVCGKALGG